MHSTRNAHESRHDASPGSCVGHEETWSTRCATRLRVVAARVVAELDRTVREMRRGARATLRVPRSTAACVSINFVRTKATMPKRENAGAQTQRSAHPRESTMRSKRSSPPAPPRERGGVEDRVAMVRRHASGWSTPRATRIVARHPGVTRAGRASRGRRSVRPRRRSADRARAAWPREPVRARGGPRRASWGRSAADRR